MCSWQIVNDDDDQTPIWTVTFLGPYSHFQSHLASLSIWQEIATTTITKQAKLTSHKLKQPKCSFLSSMHFCILTSFSLVVTAPSSYEVQSIQSGHGLTRCINHVRSGQYLFWFKLKPGQTLSSEFFLSTCGAGLCLGLTTLMFPFESFFDASMDTTILVFWGRVVSIYFRDMWRLLSFLNLRISKKTKKILKLFRCERDVFKNQSQMWFSITTAVKVNLGIFFYSQIKRNFLKALVGPKLVLFCTPHNISNRFSCKVLFVKPSHRYSHVIFVGRDLQDGRGPSRKTFDRGLAIVHLLPGRKIVQRLILKTISITWLVSRNLGLWHQNSEKSDGIFVILFEGRCDAWDMDYDQSILFSGINKLCKNKKIIFSGISKSSSISKHYSIC